jgi:predicted anti-sigma-YlaC factor YlaD
VDCDDYQELLSARLDGEGGTDTNGRLDQHLLGCRQCRRWYVRAALISKLAGAAPTEEEPDVATAVLERVAWLASAR